MSTDRHGLAWPQEVTVRITSRTLILFRDGGKLRHGDTFRALPSEVQSRVESGQLEVVTDGDLRRGV